MGINFPNSPTNGQTTTVGNTVYAYNSTVGAWEIVSSGGIGTMTTKGDILSRSSSGLARVGVGTNDYVLTADSTATPGMSWGTSPKVVANAAARPSSPYEGQMIYQADTDLLLIWNGSAWKALMQASSAGSVLQVVTNNPAFSDQNVDYATETSTGITLGSITPKSATSKILIWFTFGAYPTNFERYYSLWVRRNTVGTAVTGGGGTYGDWTMNFRAWTGAAYRESAHQHMNLHVWDVPNTTSTINYILTGQAYTGSAGALVLWSTSKNRFTMMEVEQ